MKVLFTGASSFTGYWFVKVLTEGGHDVTCTFTKQNENDYTGIRKLRVQELLKRVTPVWGCSFGDKQFLNLATRGFSAFCHHAADVTDYKSQDFNIPAALQKNTQNISGVLGSLSSSGCRVVLLTGSVFENDEGAGSLPLKAFSPYGLSKSFTSQAFIYFCESFQIRLGKFVIPNPFGPFEDPRFTAFLVKSWFGNTIPEVKTPAYVRDNIHVDLLAMAYKDFVEKRLQDSSEYMKFSPSGYVESQGTFALRVAKELGQRFNLPCHVSLLKQTSFPEPQIRINTYPVSTKYDWDEENAWNEFADFYKNHTQ
jgi:UDP-glucose 4-epimerase